MCATVVELGSGRAGCADGTDDLVGQLNHNATAEEHDMWELGERRDRVLSFRAFSQRRVSFLNDTLV